MAISATPYGLAYRNLGRGMFDFRTDALKVMLTPASYAPDVDNHEFRSSVTEISGVGYFSGGLTLANVGWTYQSDVHRCLLTADPAVWTNASFTARRAVIYRDTGSVSTSPLLSWIDLGANATVVGTPFTVTFTNGIFELHTL